MADSNGRVEWADLDGAAEAPPVPPRSASTEREPATAFTLDINRLADRLAEIMASLVTLAPNLGGKAQELLAKAKMLPEATTQPGDPPPSQEATTGSGATPDTALRALHDLAQYAAQSLPQLTAGQLTDLADQWAPVAANALRSQVEQRGAQAKTLAQLSFLIPIYAQEIKAFLTHLPELAQWTQPESGSLSSVPKDRAKRSSPKK